MKMRILTCATLLAISSTMYAQDYAFKVFGSKGNNTANGVPLKIGAKLKDSETITVDGAYLGLSNANGKTVELTSKGTYKIKELIGQTLKQANSSLTSKYAAFVVNELTKDDDESPTQNRSKYMNKTGSVDRGLDEVILLPKTALAVNSSNDTDENYKTEYYGNTIALRWFLKAGINEADRKGYRLFVTDMSENIYTSKNVDGTSFMVTLPAEAVKQPNLLLKVVPLNPKEYGANPSDELLMTKEKGILAHKVEASRAEQITKDLKEICVNADENINKLIAARYFEENGLFIDAMVKYEELIQANPNEAKYKKLYQDFLTGNKLTKETVEVEAQASNKN
jgi:hypothetical protein